MTGMFWVGLAIGAALGWMLRPRQPALDDGYQRGPVPITGWTVAEAERELDLHELREKRIRAGR